MSISNTTYITSGVTDGVTTNFSFPFRIFLTTDILVYLYPTGQPQNAVLQTLGTQYSVTISPSNSEGGSITFVTAPASGQTYLIVRQEPFTQSLSIPTEGAIPAQALTNALDLLTMQMIQINGQSVQVPFGFAGTIPAVLPQPVANLALAWDPTGLFLVNITPSAAGSLAVPIANSNLQQITLAGKVSGASLTLLTAIPSGAGVIPTANLPAICALTAGTGDNDVLQLNNSGQIPAVDGSLLTNVPMTKVQSGSLNAAASLTISSLSPGVRYKLVLNLLQNTSNGDHRITFNGDGGSNYMYSVTTFGNNSTVTASSASADYIPVTLGLIKAAYVDLQEILFTTWPGNNDSVQINALGSYFQYNSGSNYWVQGSAAGLYTGSSPLASITITPSAGTITGTWALYALN
jgi:hypothetical protein